jgi:hypothetical protein
MGNHISGTSGANSSTRAAQNTNALTSNDRAGKAGVNQPNTAKKIRPVNEAGQKNVALAQTTTSKDKVRNPSDSLQAITTSQPKQEPKKEKVTQEYVNQEIKKKFPNLSNKLMTNINLAGKSINGTNLENSVFENVNMQGASAKQTNFNDSFINNRADSNLKCNTP